MNKCYLQSVFKKLILCFSFLMLLVGIRAQVPVMSGGTGQVSETPRDAANGGAASGLGCGGGGSNWYGGNGGDGFLGGGGGGASGFSAANMIGGAGGKGAMVVTYYIGVSIARTVVYVNGTSLTIGPNFTSVKIWAIGAGGGGAGSTSGDATSGGGGGAGGISYITRAVTQGDIISYSIGMAGAGGIDAFNGSNGGNTSVTIGGNTITGNGGSGGQFNNNTNAAGGSFLAGDGGANGGSGKGIQGDQGGGGGGGIGGALGGTPTSAGGDGANSTDVSGLFAVLSSNAVLPVRWKNFTVTNQNAGALLLWETSFELNVTDYTIQYSTDGINFDNVGVMPAKNNTNGHAYKFVHQNPASGTGYYRVFQKDIDGKSNYSKTVKYTKTGAGEKMITLSTGNIVKGIIKFQLSGAAAVNLLGMDGKLISTKFFAKGYHELNIGDIKTGYYILSSKNDYQRILVQ